MADPHRKSIEVENYEFEKEFLNYLGFLVASNNSNLLQRTFLIVWLWAVEPFFCLKSLFRTCIISKKPKITIYKVLRGHSLIT